MRGPAVSDPHAGSRLRRLKHEARRLRQQTLTVYFASRDPRTPWMARVLAAMVAAYALSPIDLIPDFIPVIGYLDDIVIVTLGLAAVVRMIPSQVMDSARARARSESAGRLGYVAAALIGLVWVGVLFLLGRWLLGVVARQ